MSKDVRVVMTALSLIQMCIKQRQYVVYKGARLDLYECRSQGSNLGPYFFLPFVIDIFQYRRSSRALLHADVLKPYIEIQTVLGAAKLWADHIM